MKHIIQYLKPYRKQLILGPGAKLLEAILELMVPLLTASLIDKGVAAGDRDYVIKISGVIGLSSLAGFLFAVYCQYSAAVVSQGFGTSLRDGLMKKISLLSPADVEKLGVVSIVNRATGDINQLQLGVAMVIRLVMRAPFLCVGGAVMAILTDFKLALVLIGLMPVFIAILYFITMKTVPLYAKARDCLDGLSRILKENITGVRVVRAFAKSEKEGERFGEANGDWLKQSMKAGRFSALFSPATMLVMNLGTALIVYWGGYRVYDGGLTQGELVAFINYVTQIMLAMIVVSNLAMLFYKAAASGGRVGEILAMEPSIAYGEGGKPEGEKAVEFRHVTFRYAPGGEPALKDISFIIEKGWTIGVIGGTGAGKSTLLSLIPRLYDCSKGEVLLYGENVKTFTRRELIGTVSMTPQKAALFTGTVFSNIESGKPGVSRKEVIEAVKIAQAWEFIDRLPKKLDAPVSPGGANFSGGQRQRLCLARGIVGKKDITILDDTSSALDYATDLALRNEIKKNLQGTVFIGSQRVSSVKQADKIIVLDGGRLCGFGSHGELIENCPVYVEICKSQGVWEAEK